VSCGHRGVLGLGGDDGALGAGGRGALPRVMARSQLRMRLSVMVVPEAPPVEVDGGFGGGSGADDTGDAIAGDGPAGAAIAVDRGSGGRRRGGIGDGAVLDEAGVGVGLDGDGMGAGVAQGEIGDGDLVGGDVEDDTGEEIVGVEDGGGGWVGWAAEGEVVSCEVRQGRRQGIGASGERDRGGSIRRRVGCGDGADQSGGGGDGLSG